MKSILSKVKKEDRDNARLDREVSFNPPESDPGMEGFPWDEGDSDVGSFSGPAGGASGLFGGRQESAIGGRMGSLRDGLSTVSNPFNTPFGQSGPVAPPEEGIEDKVWNGLKVFFLGMFGFLGEFVKSLKDFDATRRVAVGKSIVVTSLVFTVLSTVLLFFGKTIAPHMLIGSLLSLGTGVIAFMFSYDDFKNAVPATGGVPEQPVIPSSGFGGGYRDDDVDGFVDDDDEPFVPHTPAKSGFSYPTLSERKELEPVVKNMDAVLDGVQYNRGMVTRQYLVDNITKFLSTVTPTFDAVRVINSGGDEFDAWDAVIRNSAEILRTGNNEDMPYLISAKDKLFYIMLEIKRVKWLKNIDNFVAEIVNICKFDEETGKTDNDIYGIGNTVGDKIFVKVMKGETAMVTIKDTFSRVKASIMDTNNYLPIILGVDPEGNVIWRDFQHINSILVTGMPRSGKSWFIQSVLTQMTFYLKPSELHFYVLDPKNEISDFKALTMPHVRKFVSSDEAILKELRNIVKVEGPRRKKIIGDAGFVNIWDFKKKNPDIELPLLYVVIDEVVTLAERMENDIKKEFQGLLMELVSQLPALGVRIFMIPHVVKDVILKKSMTDIIPCRISVRGDVNHIESAVGVKNFPHRLVHQGDMAVRLNNDEALFVHSAVLTPTNEGNKELFVFLTKFWGKVEPESVEGSYYTLAQTKEKYNDMFVGGVKVDKADSAKPSKQVNVSAGHSGVRKLSKTDMDGLLKGAHDKTEVDIWN